MLFSSEIWYTPCWQVSATKIRCMALAEIIFQLEPCAHFFISTIIQINNPKKGSPTTVNYEC